MELCSFFLEIPEVQESCLLGSSFLGSSGLESSLITELSHLWILMFFTDYTPKDPSHCLSLAWNGPSSEEWSFWVYFYLKQGISLWCLISFQTGSAVSTYLLSGLFDFINSHLCWPISPLPYNAVLPHSNFLFLYSSFLASGSWFFFFWLRFLFRLCILKCPLVKDIIMCSEFAKASFSKDQLFKLISTIFLSLSRIILPSVKYHRIWIHHSCFLTCFLWCEVNNISSHIEPWPLQFCLPMRDFGSQLSGIKQKHIYSAVWI